jgi:predicted 3-demethylubiquinone-9 3-methyltransferase (glyoxalase superfamily)
MVNCTTPDEVERLWKSLSVGGTELMPLGEYPFSKKYAWIQDRFGLSWQLMFDENRQNDQKITCNLLFSDQSCGNAEAAIRYYVEVFDNAKIGWISTYAEGEAQTQKAKVNYASFTLDGIALSAMDNGYDVDYNFNEAFSLIVNCKDQKEIDYFWEKLSAVPEAEQCGWCKDQFGVSWQILPSNWEDILFGGTDEQVQRVTEAFLSMKKFDLEALDKVRLGIH